jgi:hypothetical protein
MGQVAATTLGGPTHGMTVTGPGLLSRSALHPSVGGRPSASGTVWMGDPAVDSAHLFAQPQHRTLTTTSPQRTWG